MGYTQAAMKLEYRMYDSNLARSAMAPDTMVHAVAQNCGGRLHDQHVTFGLSSNFLCQLRIGVMPSCVARKIGQDGTQSGSSVENVKRCPAVVGCSAALCGLDNNKAAHALQGKSSAHRPLEVPQVVLVPGEVLHGEEAGPQERVIGGCAAVHARVAGGVGGHAGQARAGPVSETDGIAAHPLTARIRDQPGQPDIKVGNPWGMNFTLQRHAQQEDQSHKRSTNVPVIPAKAKQIPLR